MNLAAHARERRKMLASKTFNQANLAAGKEKKLVAPIASLARNAAKAVVRVVKNVSQALTFLMIKVKTVTTK